MLVFSVTISFGNIKVAVAFISFEDLSSPKFQALKEKYQLDTIFHGEKDELKRILLLRDWIRKVISIMIGIACQPIRQVW